MLAIFSAMNNTTTNRITLIFTNLLLAFVDSWMSDVEHRRAFSEAEELKLRLKIWIMG